MMHSPIAALLALSLALPNTLAAVLQSRQSSNITCHSGLYLLVAPGTFENLEPGNSTYGFQAPVVNAILAAIPNSAAAVIVYPENTDISVGIPQGVTYAQNLLTEYYAACPNGKTALMGYSQGAIVTGSTLAGGPAYVPIFGSTGVGPAALSREIGENIVAIVQFGDLNRVEGVGIDADLSDTPCRVNSTYPRNGTAGTNWAHYSDRITEYCANSDPACCAGQINFFAHLGYFTTANIQSAAAFVKGKFGM